MKVASHDDFIKMGFVAETDGSGSPWGNSWDMRTTYFHLFIDCTFEVKLMRLNPDTDGITLLIEDLYELQQAVDFIQD